MSGKQRIPQFSYHQIRPAPIVLISGAEQFLATRVARELRQMLRTATPTLEIHRLDAAEYHAGELFTVASPSLFAEPRLVQLDGIEHASDALLTDLTRYLAQPASDTTVVLRHAGGQRGKKLLDTLRGAAGAAAQAIEIACTEIKKDTDRLQFAQAEFRRLDAHITAPALRTLLDAYQGDLGELAGAIAQLVATHGSPLGETAVQQATEGRVEASAFTVADAALAGRVADALTLLRQSLATGTDPIPLLAALGMKIRNMARVYDAPGSPNQIAQAFGMAPWQVERARKETRGWAAGNLARAVELVAETELALKGGSRDPLYTLERTVLFIAQRGTQP